MMMQPQYPVPPWMFGAVQNTESGGNPNAVSPAGAVGSMQVMPTTLTDPGFGVAPARDNSPQEQQRVGKDYLQAMMQRYQGDPQKALMAYNWGPGNVDKLQSGQVQLSQIPTETQAYVPKVMNQQPGTQYAQNENIQNDGSQPSKMDLMLEAERRGILPSDKQDLLNEARSRGLIADDTKQPDLMQAFMSGAYAPFKPIVDDSLEALKNTATATGEAMSEPYNEQNVPGWMMPIDVGMKTLGRVGNAIGGTGQALFSPVTGGLTASAEATMPLQEKLLGAEGRLTPQQEHQIAQEEGGYMASGVGAAMGANAKTNIVRNQQGGPPPPPPFDPLQPVWDNLSDMSANNAPRVGFFKSNSSDPMQAPNPETPSSAQVRDYATQKFQQGDAQGGMLKPNITNSWADKALQVLPQSEEAQAVFGKESPVAQMVARIQTLRDKPMSLQGTLEIEKGLGDLVENNVNPATGKVDAIGNQYLELQHGLRDLWQNATDVDTIGGKSGFDAAKEGRELWAQSAKMNDIERIQSRANGTQNPAQAIRTGMNNFMNTPTRTRGWSNEEIASGHAAAKAGFTSGVIKLGSNRFVAPVVGSLLGGPVGAAVGAGLAESTNGILNSRQNARVGNVLNTMASRPVVQRAMNPAPAPQSVARPMLALPAPETTHLTNGYGQTVSVTPAGRQSLGQMEATHNPADGLPQHITSPSEILQQYGSARLFDADKLPPIIYRPGNPGALGNAEYMRLQQLSDAQRANAPTNAPVTQSVVVRPTANTPLSYKDYLAQAQKIINQAAASGKPMKNTDIAKSLADALMNMKRGK